MIEVHTWEPNANSGESLFCLAEKGVEFVHRYVDEGGGEQFSPEFLPLNPDGAIPALAVAAVSPYLAPFAELGVTIPAAVAAWLDRVAACTSVRALAANILAVPTMSPEAGRWG